jgi:release factor glutamine methyltransferase
MLAATHNLAAARQIIAEKLRRAGIDSAETDARLLISHALGIDRAGMIADPERRLNAEERLALDELVERRLKREPVARIFGFKEFWSLLLHISPAVLVPRPETETVIDLALDFIVRGGLRMEKLRILDIGTGSGALLLALLSEMPNAHGTGTDISMPALEVARINAERHALASRCTFENCDLVSGLAGHFDLIVCNPPYVAHAEIETLEPEVRNYDPAIALDGGSDGLNGYRALAKSAPYLLASGGWLIVELGVAQEAAVRTLFTNVGLTVNAVRSDLAGIPRALCASVCL